MTEKENTKPSWATDYPCWENIVESWGYNILGWEIIGDYQGDYLILLSHPDGRYGFLTIGYGSCSGCDALEASAPWDEDGDWSEAINLAKATEESIHWVSSAEDLIAYLKSELTQNDWWYYEEETSDALNKFIETLRDRS